MKSNLGDLIWKLAQAKGISQSDVARHIGRASPQVNRFFTGKSDITTSNLSLILKTLGINLEEILLRRIRILNSQTNVESVNDSILYLYENLDPQLRAMILQSLVTANKVSESGELPESVIRILNEEFDRLNEREG